MSERLLSGPDWLQYLDPKNEGRRQGWMHEPHPDAVESAVPSCIEETFPNAGQVSWHWKRFDQDSLSEQNRFFLQFDGVDFFAEAWLNGRYLGGSESANLPFSFDATAALQRGENLLAARLVKAEPIGQGGAGGKRLNYGGILQDVRLVSKRRQWIEDAFIRPNPSDSSIDVWVEIGGGGGIHEPLTLEATVSPDFPETGLPVARARGVAETGVGKQTCRLSLFLPTAHLRLWEIHDAFLYRLNIALMRGSEIYDLWTDRFGMREFGFDGSHITLNGRPLLLRALLYRQVWPVTVARPFSVMAERDIELARKAGANAICAYSKSPSKATLDACDEQGVMVQVETLAASHLNQGSAAARARRLEELMTRQVKRDRNRASALWWRCLNENGGELLAYATQQVMPKLRALDPTRMIVNANSGDPEERVQWLPNEPAPKRQFHQLRLNRDEDSGMEPLESLRGRKLMEPADSDAPPFYLSEWGAPSHGSEWDELLANYAAYDLRLADLEAFRAVVNHHRDQYALHQMEERGFPTFNAFLTAGKLAAAKRYEEYLTALWGNPRALGHCLASLEDSGYEFSGVVDIWRRPKVGAFQKIREMNSKSMLNVDWQPRSLYINDPLNMDIALVNEQAVEPGEYVLTLSLQAADQTTLWRLNENVRVTGELIQPLFADSLPGSSSGGPHRLTAQIRKLDDGENMPAAVRVRSMTIYPRELEPAQTPDRLVVWEENGELTQLLKRAGASARSLTSLDDVQYADVAAVSKRTLKPNEMPIWNALLKRWRSGAALVVLDRRLFADEQDSTARLPEMDGWKPPLRALPRDFGAARFILRHPIFDGLPQGCAVGSTDVYARVCPVDSWEIHSRPSSVECEAAALYADIGRLDPYAADVCILRNGKAQLTLTTFNLVDHLNVDPAADRLALNMMTALGCA